MIGTSRRSPLLQKDFARRLLVHIDGLRVADRRRRDRFGEHQVGDRFGDFEPLIPQNEMKALTIRTDDEIAVSVVI